MVRHELSDEELLLRFRDTGDSEAFRLLVERTAPGVLRVARGVGLGADEIDDLVQDTYLVVLARVGAFDSTLAAAPWIRGIARKTALRARNARRESSLEAGQLVTTEEPRELAGRAEARAALRRTLSMLRPRYRQVIELYYLEHMSTEAIAQVLDRRPSTVRTQIMRGVTALRRFLPFGLATVLLTTLDPRASASASPRHRPSARGSLRGRPWARASLVAALPVLVVLTALLVLVERRERPAAAHPEASAGGSDLVAGLAPTVRRESVAPAQVERRGSVIEDAPTVGVVLETRVLHRATRMPVAFAALGLELVDPRQPLDGLATIASFRPAVTDANGVVRLADVAGETLRFRYGQMSASGPFEADRPPAEVYVERVAVVSGRVVVGGLDVPEAEIWCSELGNDLFGRPYRVARTDAHGRFTVTFVNSDAKGLWACAGQDQRSPLRKIELRRRPAELEPDAQDVVLVLADAPGSVHGRVSTGPGRAPVEGALVAAYPEPTRPRRPPSFAWTRADGTYEIRTLPPGTYDLIALGPDGAGARDVVSLTLDAAQAWSPVLAEPAAIRGRLVDSTGTPLGGRIVVAAPKRTKPRFGPQLLWKFGRTAADGTLAIDGVLAGEVVLSVASPDKPGFVHEEDRFLAPGETAWWPLVVESEDRVQVVSDRIALIMDQHRRSTSGYEPPGQPNAVPPSSVRVAVGRDLFALRRELQVSIAPDGDDPELAWRGAKVTPENPTCVVEGVVPGAYRVAVLASGLESLCETSIRVRADSGTVVVSFSSAAPAVVR